MLFEAEEGCAVPWLALLGALCELASCCAAAQAETASKTMVKSSVLRIGKNLQKDLAIAYCDRASHGNDVPPVAATEQNHHQKTDQKDFPFSSLSCTRKWAALRNHLSLPPYTFTIVLAKTGCLVTLDHFDLGWADGRSRRCALTQWNRSDFSQKRGTRPRTLVLGQSSLVCARFEHQCACAS